MRVGESEAAVRRRIVAAFYPARQALAARRRPDKFLPCRKARTRIPCQLLGASQLPAGDKRCQTCGSRARTEEGDSARGGRGHCHNKALRDKLNNLPCDPCV